MERSMKKVHLVLFGFLVILTTLIAFILGCTSSGGGGSTQKSFRDRCHDINAGYCYSTKYGEACCPYGYYYCKNACFPNQYAASAACDTYARCD